MVEKKNIPQIRLSRFTKDWNKELLSNYLETSKIRNSDESFTKEDVLSVSGDAGVVNQIEYQGRSFAGASLANYGIASTNDIVYTKSPLRHQPYGIIKTNTGKPGIVSALYAVYHPKENLYPPFVQTYFNLDIRLNDYLRPIISKGAKNTINVSDDAALLGTVLFPEYDEQQNITNIFSELEILITRKQARFEKLQTMKIAMLEKMFPHNDANVPKVRFKEFTGAWSQYQLKDIVQPYSDPVQTPDGGYFRVGIRSHGKGTFHSFVAPGMELETAKMHKVAENNLIVNITFAWEHAVAITNETDSGKLVSHRFPQFKFNDNMLPRFFKYAILDDKFRHHLWLASPGGAGRNRVLKIDEMLKYKFWIPETVREQEKIADYLDQLTKMIDSVQHELIKLQHLKKALLEKMFV